MLCIHYYNDPLQITCRIHFNQKRINFNDVVIEKQLYDTSNNRISNWVWSHSQLSFHKYYRGEGKFPFQLVLMIHFFGARYVHIMFAFRLIEQIIFHFILCFSFSKFKWLLIRIVWKMESDNVNAIAINCNEVFGEKEVWAQLLMRFNN